MKGRLLTSNYNVWDIRESARRRLPLPLFNFLEGGAEDEWTLRRNISAYDQWAFTPRVLCDVAAIDTTTAVLGETIALPVMLSPTGLSRVFHPDGEAAAARAAAKAGTIYTLSTTSSLSIEEVAAATAGPKWFQIYCFRDRELTRGLMARAKAAGYTRLVVTVDVPVTANRERDHRSGMTIPPKLTLNSMVQFARRPGWVWDYLTHKRPGLANVSGTIAGARGKPISPAYISNQFDSSVTWKDVEWMIGQWDGPVIVKGILNPADAKIAQAIGAKAVVISNHGGRQLDSATATLDALPRIADAVGNGIELILDGGIRRGTHVLKALCLGAKACMIGRPYLYGLAAGGEAGVSRALALLRDEIRRDMALLGATAIPDLSQALMVRS
jgi:L-lactate dehydrogenase (cytochrome)